MNQAQIDQVKDYLLNLQNTICIALEGEEPSARFIEEQWTRAEGGGVAHACWQKAIYLSKPV